LSSEAGKPVPRKRLTAAERREVIERAATEVFAERGYASASMDEVARRSGVSVPVVYDHFASKQDLHRRLLERHFAELGALWREHLLTGEDPAEQRIPKVFDAWFGYVQSHPYAWRMLFRDTTGDPAAQAIHREVAEQSRKAVTPLLARELHTAGAAATAAGEQVLEMTWEIIRSAFQGLALWWYEHPDVPREQLVAAMLNTLWIGLERAVRGETWRPGRPRSGRAAAVRKPAVPVDDTSR